MRLLPFLCIFSFIIISAAPPVDRTNGSSLNSSKIKVLLGKNKSLLNLKSEKGIKLLKIDTGEVFTNFFYTNINLTFSSNRIFINKNEVLTNNFLIKSLNGALSYRSRKYRGDFVISYEKKFMYLINLINIEDYLKGVLPHEIDYRWKLEALKAQAIASRSFAYVKMVENKNKLYDLDNSAFSQVYKGINSEHASINYAIDETKGMVLWYKDRVAVGFFHSSCGGCTEYSGNVWGSSLPYLKGKKSKWCRNTKYYRWGFVLTRKQIKNIFGITYPLLYAKVIKKYSSGRVKALKLISGNGKVFVYSGRRFRHLIGYNRLRSRKFIIKVRGPYLQILGNGWGHGVGMCQWCSSVMAKKGKSAVEILKFFYEGIEIKKYRIDFLWD